MTSISVVIPAYNAELTIYETICSVQQQTLKDLEIIVINDGSTDGTLTVLNQIQEPRLKIFTYENGGLPIARNRGISQASGDFIAFLDADDLWTPDKLELQMKSLADHPEAAVAYSWTVFMDEQGQSFHQGQRFSYFEGNVLKNLLAWNFIESGSNPLIRREAIETVGEFDPSQPPAADWDYWLRLAIKYPFVLVRKPQIFYRQSGTQMSSKVEAMENSQLSVLDKIFDRLPPDLYYLRNKSVSHIYQYSTQLYLNKLKGDEGVRKAQEKFIQSVKLYPPILFDGKTLNLALKLLIRKMLPDTISELVLDKIKRLKARSKTSLKDV